MRLFAVTWHKIDRNELNTHLKFELHAVKWVMNTDPSVQYQYSRVEA